MRTLPFFVIYLIIKARFHWVYMSTSFHHEKYVSQCFTGICIRMPWYLKDLRKKYTDKNKNRKLLNSSISQHSHFCRMFAHGTRPHFSQSHSALSLFNISLLFMSSGKSSLADVSVKSVRCRNLWTDSSNFVRVWWNASRKPLAPKHSTNFRWWKSWNSGLKKKHNRR